MCTFRQKALLLSVFVLTTQGCMVSTPHKSACATGSVAPSSPALGAKMLPPTVPGQETPNPVATLNKPGAAPADTDMELPSFLLNNMTQLLLVCAATGNCR
jgi:hypothetical protein